MPPRKLKAMPRFENSRQLTIADLLAPAKSGVRDLDRTPPKKSIPHTLLYTLEEYMEDLNSGTGMQFLTLTFKPVYDSYTLRTLNLNVIERVTKYIKRYPEIRRIVMFPEVSPGGKFHYHGIIYCNDTTLIGLFCRWYARIYGRVKNEGRPKHGRAVYDYITKDYGKLALGRFDIKN